MLAAWTTTTRTNPKVSTNRCRLIPLIFFPRVVATRPAGPRGFDGLTVEGAGAGLGFLAGSLPDLVSEGVVDPFPSAVAPPAVEIVANRSLRGKVVGQGVPGTAGLGQVEEGIEGGAKVCRPRGTGRDGRWEQGLEKFPLRVRQVTGITAPRWSRRHRPPSCRGPVPTLNHATTVIPPGRES